ncbi:hypothetical protein AOLI_G00174410 [Acnodon oligacanthus]
MEIPDVSLAPRSAREESWKRKQESFDSTECRKFSQGETRGERQGPQNREFEEMNSSSGPAFLPALRAAIWARWMGTYHSYYPKQVVK